MTGKRAFDAVMALLAFYVLAGCSKDKPQNEPRTSEKIAVSQQAIPSPHCVTIRQIAPKPPALVQDATIRQGSSSNEGSADKLYTGRPKNGPEARAVIRFDLSSIPAKAAVTAATLTISHSAKTQDATVQVHRVDVRWLEPAVTWNTIGNSFDPVPVASFVVPAGSADKRTVDVLPLVQSWVSATPLAPNYGILLNQPTGSITEYSSSETPEGNVGDSSQRPKLDVCYATCTDGIQNGAETGIDCGGPSCPVCCTPSDEICDGIDNDCDGAVDDGLCGVAPDACHLPGSCNAATGQCVYPNAPDGTSCSDGSLCTQTDACQAGTCTGSNPVQCSAQDACHVAGTCDPATGVCSNPTAPNGAPCDDGNACTQTDACQAGTCTGGNPVVCAAQDACHVAGTCNPATGVCTNPPAPNGTSCNDGNACTQTDTCQSGACTGGNPVQCSAQDDCHSVGTCNPATGVCSNPSVFDGTPCSDGNACTKSDSCMSGVCTGSNPVVCTAQDACHVVGTCDPANGACSNPAAPDGTGCNDGNTCTQTDTCQGGVCAGGNPVQCTAQDDCHSVGTCDPATGVCSNPSAFDGTPCNDENACTQTDSCVSGVCTGSNAVVCVAQDVCHTAGTCDPATGVCSNPAAPDGTGCNDGDACTQTDACQGGACTGGNPVQCVAQDACHVVGTCDPVSGACSNPAALDGTSCSDGNACTQTDACQGGACVGSNAVVCAASDACHVAGTCDPATGACSNPAAADGTGCSDGNACTQTDACLGGACVGSNTVVCAASDACHVAGTCDPATGACSNPAAADGTGCSDGNACTQTDACQGGACVGSNAVVCAGSDACHVAGTCDSATGACSNPAAADGTGCSDGNACTQTDACLGGACVGSNAVVCAASDACHVAGTCDPATGACSNPTAPNGTSCSDGNACTQTDACLGGACVGSNAVVCAASDACHVAGTCDPATGACSNPTAPNGTSCSDGNACTQTDACQGGACVGSNAVVCAASDACHVAGTCDPATGACSNPTAPNGTSCSDGNACTQADTCQNGACASGSPVQCAPQDACHEAGTCDPATGACSVGPALVDGTGCSDGNACTQNDSCQAGTCVPGAGVTCTPVNDCREAGTCNPATGACSLGPALPDSTHCDDASADTEYDTCQAGTCVGGHSAVVTIISPLDGAVASGNNIQVLFTVTFSDPNESVLSASVNNVAAVLTAQGYLATVPLHEGSNLIMVEVVGTLGTPGSASLMVIHDTRPPRVAITQPAERELIAGNVTTVTGSVHDMVLGTVGTGDCTVLVNGLVAEVQNGSFRAENVPVAEGAGTITVVATDAAGNRGSAVIEVTGDLASNAMILKGGGDGQAGVVGTPVAQSLTVQLVDNTGQGVPGREVTFMVTRSNGSLGLDQERSVMVVSDTQGFASTTLTLGTTVGEGSDQVRAKARGFLGTATFAATAVLDPNVERVLTVASGGSQKGTPNSLAPLPLAVFLSDGQGNPMASEDVTFTVKRGGGRVNGASAVTVSTDYDGRAFVLLTMGTELGDGSQVVEATAPEANAVTFMCSTIPKLDPANTTITGLVLTNENDPIQNAVVEVEGLGIQGTTDADGRFVLSAPLPADTVGYKRIHLDVRGAFGGPFPSELEFEMDLIPGIENTMDRPVYLPAVDTDGTATANTMTDIEIRRPDVPGFLFTVPAGTATFIEDAVCTSNADCDPTETCKEGHCTSKEGLVQVITVHNDKIPMLPSDGALPTLAFAIMPHTARFDPPAPIRMPNVDGREPGEMVQLYSYDHDVGQFVIVGTATVSEDGQEIASERGQGIVKGGWHYIPPAPAPGTCLKNVCRAVICTDCGEIFCPAPPYVPQVGCWSCRVDPASGIPTNCCGVDANNTEKCCIVYWDTGTIDCQQPPNVLLPEPSASPIEYSPDYQCYGSNFAFGCTQGDPCTLELRNANGPPWKSCERGHDFDHPALSGASGLCIDPSIDDNDPDPDRQHIQICCPKNHICCVDGPCLPDERGENSTANLMCCDVPCALDGTCP